MWENIVEPDRPRDNMAHVRCILDTSGYKHILRICNTWCFSPKQWLLERVSVLLCTYIACLFFLIRNVVYALRFEMNLVITRRCRGSGCCRRSLTAEVHVLLRVRVRFEVHSDVGEGFYSGTSVRSVSIIPKMLHSHVSTKVMRRTRGRNVALKTIVLYPRGGVRVLSQYSI